MVVQQTFGDWYDDSVDGLSENDKAAARMARNRAAARNIKPGAVVNPARRDACCLDTELFCKTYLRKLFYNDFSESHLDIIEGTGQVIEWGGFQAIAAPRGDGKTTLTMALTMHAVLYGIRQYVVIFAANAGKASKILDTIKYILTHPDEYSALAEDFPEVCQPAVNLEGAAQKAKKMTYDGQNIDFEWNADSIILPTVKVGGELTSGSGGIIQTMGIDGSIRGLNIRGRRPDLAIIDDPQNDASAKSVALQNKLEENIEQGVQLLGGQDKPIAIVMPCTVIKPSDIADRYTDREAKPLWRGVRHKMLSAYPDNMDYWIKYRELRFNDVLAGDRTGRTAHHYYLANQTEMDAGARVSNPGNFYRIQCKDGSQMEVSGIQHALNKWCDLGAKAFAAECQNEPLALDTQKLDVNDLKVMKKLSGFERGVVPDWAQLVTVGVDIAGRKLHWTATAWGAGMIGCIIDYGALNIDAPDGDLRHADNRQHLTQAILRALYMLDEHFEQVSWHKESTGEVIRADLVVMDSGSGMHQDAVYSFCRNRTGGIYWPLKGFGQGQRAGSRYRAPRDGEESLVAAHYHATYQADGMVWLYSVDADYYKIQVHEGVLTPTELGGSISLFGDSPAIHRDFSHSICAEIWTAVFSKGSGIKEKFDVVHPDNHWLDATAYSYAAAEMLEIEHISMAESA